MGIHTRQLSSKSDCRRRIASRGSPVADGKPGSTVRSKTELRWQLVSWQASILRTPAERGDRSKAAAPGRQVTRKKNSPKKTMCVKSAVQRRGVASGQNQAAQHWQTNAERLYIQVHSRSGRPILLTLCCRSATICPVTAKRDPSMLTNESGESTGSEPLNPEVVIIPARDSNDAIKLASFY